MTEEADSDSGRLSWLGAMGGNEPARRDERQSGPCAISGGPAGEVALCDAPRPGKQARKALRHYIYI